MYVSKKAELVYWYWCLTICTALPLTTRYYQIPGVHTAINKPPWELTGRTIQDRIISIYNYSNYIFKTIYCTIVKDLDFGSKARHSKKSVFVVGDKRFFCYLSFTKNTIPGPWYIVYLERAAGLIATFFFGDFWDNLVPSRAQIHDWAVK